MSNYDFKPLNDKEFEVLCADLLGAEKKVRFERFKAGRDGGVDGRYFTDNGEEIILQCKHWLGTPLSKLISYLRSTEKPKLDKLSPHQYLLAVSNPLSRDDKKKIVGALAPHIKSESDVYGSEDLNDILKKNPKIERQHYKLWLHSSSVLGHILNNAICGRSEFALKEIIELSSRYVVTKNHRKALALLNTHRVVIITGDPGIGKTTLADHLCLEYYAQGFAYLKIGDDIKEAESAFDPDSKQIIYFDDFLGRNYLAALKGHEGSRITQFIRRVAANKNKRFVLTSRSTILNQGKLLIDSFDQDNMQRNEYELRITSLTDMDKAQILYNHIWHSTLEKKYIEQLYIGKRYRYVIYHENFNPRLINYITDASRIKGYSAEQYWSYIEQSLTNPTQIWENPFVAQQDDFGRAIIMLVVLNGEKIIENILSEVYQRYISLPENQNMQGRQEFQSNIRILTGSFLNRTIANTGTLTRSFGKRKISRNSETVIDLFNPSIGDFVLARYARDVMKIKLGMLSLRTYQSLLTLKSLMQNDLMPASNVLSVCNALLGNLVNNKFEGASVKYTSLLCDIYRSSGGGIHDSSGILRAINFTLDEGLGCATSDSFESISWAVSEKKICPKVALAFVSSNINEDLLYDDASLKAVISLLEIFPKDTPGKMEVTADLKRIVVDFATEDLPNFIEMHDAYSVASWGEHEVARDEVERLVRVKFKNLGFKLSKSEIEQISKTVDIPYELDKYHMNISDYDDSETENPASLAVDEIDDLFER